MGLVTQGRCISKLNKNVLRFYMQITFAFLFFSEECSDRGGTSAGSCAEGYGVCCTCKTYRIIYSCNS